MWKAILHYANAQKLIFYIILLMKGKVSRENIIFLVVILLECVAIGLFLNTKDKVSNIHHKDVSKIIYSVFTFHKVIHDFFIA